MRTIARQKQDHDRPDFEAYVDLRAAFASLSRPALWSLTGIGIPEVSQTDPNSL